MKAHSVESADLIQGAEPGGAAFLIELSQNATVLCY
jgi:hypothetical protein